MSPRFTRSFGNDITWKDGRHFGYGESLRCLFEIVTVAKQFGSLNAVPIYEIVAGNPKLYAQMVPILSRYSRTRQQAA